MSTIKWTGAAGDNNFNNPANWNPQQVPGAGDTASLPKGALAQIGFAVTDTVANLTTVAGATLAVSNNGTFALGTASIAHNTVSNGGTIALEAGNNFTDLIFASLSTTLTGGGTILLNDDGNNRLYGASASDVLVNSNNLIEGGGQIGAGQLTLTNGAAGIIDGNATNNQLVLNTGSNTVTNSGLIEAGAGAGLQIQNTRIDSSSGGTIAALGANVQLNGATLAGGTLVSSGGFALMVDFAQVATLDGSASTITNKGQIDVTNNGTVTLLGTIANSGTIALQAGNNGTGLLIGPGTGAVATVTLNGGGLVSLGDDPNNFINASQAGDTLVNVNDTISGAGSIGGGVLTLNNKSTIDASGTNALVINTGGGPATNSGLMEGTNTGDLVLQNTVFTNTGTIGAFGGNVDLVGATVNGGTLASSGTGVIFVDFAQSATLAGLTNTGQIEATNNGTIALGGTLINQGTISLLGGNNNTDLVAGTATVTLTGGGVVLLDDDPNNRIYGSVAANVLDNVNNIIEGAGQLGTGQLTLINEIGGTIDATGVNNALVINTSGDTLVNHHLIEATGAAGLVVNATRIDDSSGGTLLAHGGNITLDGSTIAGGLIKSLGTSATVVNFAQGAAFDGTASAVTLQGNVDIFNNGTLTLLGTLDNAGTINVLGGNNFTDLVIGPSDGSTGTVTLTGGGTILMNDDPDSRLYGGTASDTLLNLNNTISGAGQIGAGQLNLINDGTIDATGGNALVVVTTSFMNNALLEATGAGGLAINGSVVSNAGTIAAAGGNVVLNGSTIAGGLITSSGGGAFVVNFAQTAALDASNGLTSTAMFDVTNNGTLDLLGTFTNRSTLALQAGNNYTDLIVTSAAATLTGGGTLTLSDNTTGRIYGAAGSDILDNINNTIVGAGQLGAGQLTLVNGAAGIIDASGVNNALVISTGTTLTNAGLIEATGVGGMVLTNTIYDGSSGGTLLAAGGNINVNGASIIGGTLASTGTSELYIGFAQQATLDGTAHTVTNTGTFAVTNNGTLLAYTALNNRGTIALQGGNNYTDLIIETPTLTLTGLGTISLSDDGNNRIYGAAAADVLNNVNNTIVGAGQLGAGQLTVTNSGTIEAVGSNALQVNLGSTLTNNANGKLLGVGAGGLSLQNGTYTNSGLIEAQDASSVTFRSDAVLTNSANGTLTGGTYEAMARGDGATVSITGSPITTDAAAIILSGAGSNILFGGTGIESSLTTIAKGGSLQALGGRGYTTTLKLVNSGTIDLAGGTFKAPTLNDKVGSTLSGFGSVASKVTSAGAIVATGGTLDLKGATNTISGATSGTGTLSFDKGTTTFNAGATLGGSNIAVINAANLVLNTGLSFAGTFDIVGATTLTGAGGFTNTGLFEQTGTGTGAISDPFTNAGTIATAAGGTLAFTGGLANTGLILDNGGFTDTAALTGGSLTVGGSGSAATIATGAAPGPSTIATLTVGGGTLNTSNTVLTVTGDYDNTAAGVGNAYNPLAGVTGTIKGQGTQLTVVGVNGTTITTINGVMTIGVTKDSTASFVIENTGAAGSAALRGALQTTVNGANINGTNLSGSGVTAQDFGPIAAGSSSGIFNIAYTTGSLGGDSIHIATDFANVAGLTLNIRTMAPPMSEPMSVPAATPAASGTIDWSHGIAAADLIVPAHGAVL